MTRSALPVADRNAIPSTKASTRGRASVLLAVATALAMAVTVALGVWQLQRAALKETLASQVASRGKLPALNNFAQLAPARQAPSPAASTADGASRSGTNSAAALALVHQRVDLRGLWLHQHTVFLDNRYMGGRPGFIVATPLQIAGGGQLVWVQRGWVPRDPLDRARLPGLPSGAEPVSVQGRVVAEVSRVYALGGATEPATAQASAPSAAGASRIWQNLPMVDFGSAGQLLPLAVLQTESADAHTVPDGLQRDWPALDSGVAKHYGYAFQWFALCGLIMVLYAWFQFFVPRRRTL